MTGERQAHEAGQHVEFGELLNPLEADCGCMSRRELTIDWLLPGHKLWPGHTLPWPLTPVSPVNFTNRGRPHLNHQDGADGPT